jgi:hypothetical protein
MRDSFPRHYARRLFLVISFLSLATAISCVPPDRAPLAIKGYDPVAFFAVGKPMLGHPEIEVAQEGVRYRFFSEENREIFTADPSHYMPQFGDFCAMALSKGELVEADPENWLIVDGKLYIFGKPTGAQLFQKDLGGNVLKANGNRSLLPKP